MNSKCDTTWLKSNEIQTYGCAKVTVFARFESESARLRHGLCFHYDAARGKFYRPGAHRPTQEATMVKVNIFFTFEGLSSVWLLSYERFHAALLFWSSPDSWLAIFHSQQCLYIHTAYPSTKTGVHCDVEHWGLRSQQFCKRCGFFPPGALVTSFLSQPISTVIPVALTFNKTKPSCSLLDRRRHESHLVPAFVASGNIHNAVSCHLDENRVKQRSTVFSMNKAQERKLQSTNWRRRHLGYMRKQPRRWPGFDKCVETKLRLDVFTRPWPPGWFLCNVYLRPVAVNGLRKCMPPPPPHTWFIYQPGFFCAPKTKGAHCAPRKTPYPSQNRSL